MENISNNSNNLYLVALAVATAFISYGIFCFNLVIAGDDWTTVVNGDWLRKYTISIGRWAHYSITTLFGKRLFAPTFTFMFLALCQASVLKPLFSMMGIDNTRAKIVFTLLFVSCPLWYEAYIFNMGRMPKGIGLISAVFGASFLLKSAKTEKLELKEKFLVLCGVLLISLSIGCYQTYLFFAIFPLAVFLLHKLIKLEFLNWIKICFNIFLLIVLSIITYIIITFLYSEIYNINLSSGGKYGISTLTQESKTNTIYSTFITIFHFYSEEQLLIPQLFKWILSFNVLLYFVIVAKKLLGTNEKLIKISFFIVLFLFLVIHPFALGFFRGDEVFRYNSMNALSISLAFFLIQGLVITKNAKLRNVNTIVLGAIIIWFNFSNSSASFSKYISNKRDFALSEKLLSYIHESPNYGNTSKAVYKIYFAGRNPYMKEQRPFDIVNDNEFDFKSIINQGVWDGQIGRMKNIFYILGETNIGFNFYPNYHKNTKKILKDIRNDKNNYINFNSIKNWPHKSSVISLKDGLSFLVVFNTDALN